MFCSRILSGSLILLLLFLVPLLSQAQGVASKKTFYEFSTNAKFWKVDDRYNLIGDTVFHTDAEFRLKVDYDKTFLGGEEYYVFHYDPIDFNKKKKGKGNKTTSQNRTARPKPNPGTWGVGMNNVVDENDVNGENSDQGEVVETTEALASRERAQMQRPVNTELDLSKKARLAIKAKDFELMLKEGILEPLFQKTGPESKGFSSGFMSIPFKLRPKQDSLPFNMTTDVTLGAYLGRKYRISERGNNFLIIPITLGLTYINYNDNTSSKSNPGGTGVVPGWTGSLGGVFDLGGFNVGLVGGVDFASGTGSDWVYQGHPWFSFSIGHSFLQNR